MTGQPRTEPNHQEVVEALQRTHPDAVQAAYWRVKAALLQGVVEGFQSGPTLETIDNPGGDDHEERD